MEAEPEIVGHLELRLREGVHRMEYEIPTFHWEHAPEADIPQWIADASHTLLMRDQEPGRETIFITEACWPLGLDQGAVFLAATDHWLLDIIINASQELSRRRHHHSPEEAS
jgi:hypothetical protein